jgi:small GTP-binding protein
MKIDIERFTKISPDSETHLKRLKFLKENANEIRVAVFGKFNHGKSTLLNAIIGENHFAVADKRETTEVSEYKYNNIIWVDTPGLDADVHGEDDKRAREGAFKIADFLFLVHSVNAGELDHYEMQLYRDLIEQDTNYNKKMFLVLTQIDQLEKEDFQRVHKRIKEQFPQLNSFSVSATRYIRGTQENKSIFIEKSGMNELLKLINAFNRNIKSIRENEKTRLTNKVLFDLSEKRRILTIEVNQLHHQLTTKNTNFTSDLKNCLSSIQSL